MMMNLKKQKQMIKGRMIKIIIEKTKKKLVMR